jgi:hypothetical protein
MPILARRERIGKKNTAEPNLSLLQRRVMGFSVTSPWAERKNSLPCRAEGYQKGGGKAIFLLLSGYRIRQIRDILPPLSVTASSPSADAGGARGF